MRRYERYKDSGVEWLGKIPSHWDLTIGMNVFRENKRDNKGMKEKTVLSLSYGQIIIKPEEKLVGLVPESFETYQIVEPNDIIIRCTDLQNDQTSLRTGLAKDKGIITSAYLNLKVINNYSAKFLHYYLHTLDITKVLYKFGSGLRQNLSFLDFKRLPIIDIPLSEQQKIAQFLDDKTAKIDQAVDLAEKQIALLKEHKQILIQNAVTRGLNPDVPLKDSGVEWIGQVPEHWDIKRFRNLFDFGKGLSITKENLQDEGIPCVNYGEVHSRYGFEVIPERDALKCVDSKYLVFNNSMLNKGDFVFADTSEDIEGSGNFTYLNSSTRIFAGYHTVITRLKITAIHRYIAYYFDSLSFRNQIRNKVKGVNVFSITQSILKGTFVLLPNLKEQQQIADYLDTQTAKIDQAIALKTAHIEKLKEYKSVLINDVVTGKVRV
ncbi:restriction endonuclease subunit S [Haemophilus influenzae]|uniref:restriction endonuclease subunit S n=1 Tax=Haemophilus influenzae TaxID=727 RepID=UPI000DD367D5|nr:restriction endonuclease subunit S [Haemophilus influenzae]MCK9087512.1 restriction endonuclease subunit S [Haemophilus influenzae]MCK9107056.1 restriction endonuclease subunit S [Haemophilus influenzae]